MAAKEVNGRWQAQPMLPGIEFSADAEAAATGADALVIVTEWDEFRAIDLDDIASGQIVVGEHSRQLRVLTTRGPYRIGGGRNRCRRQQQQAGQAQEPFQTIHRV